MTIQTPQSAPRKKLPLKERYSLLTRDLDWEPSYVSREKLFPHTSYEGIKIHDWDGWEDPFRLTVDAYYKYQAEKDKRLYASLDTSRARRRASRRCARASMSCGTVRRRSTRSATTTSTTAASTVGRRCMTGSGIYRSPSL